jgi:hypothetical protein
VLYKIPIAANGGLGDAEAIPVTGPAGVTGDFGLNGIDTTPDGKTLFVVHTSLGQLFTVDPQTGVSKVVAITGGSLMAGTLDGILLDGKTMWIVEGFVNRLVGVNLSPDFTSGEITAVLTNDDVDGLFRVPATVAEHGNRLALVNARFDQGLPPPFGPGAPPGTDFDVVVVDKP